jgi:predicted AlkP superfamily pyrophosphatase or phosphodiesterase
VIILDGLRPDYITPELMPNLHALAQSGIFSTNNHSAIPTVTRVNASTLATGAYPKTHGILGNTIYIPEVNPNGGISTWDYKNLIKVEEALDGHLMTTISMGEILEESGKEILVVSSGSTGSAFLLNHKVKGRGIINVDMILPESRREAVMAKLGNVPEDRSPNEGRNAWAVNAFFMELEENGLPDLTYMWLSDPDHTAHAFGIGAPQSNLALHLIDIQIGRIVAKRKSASLENRLNIIVTADHGFSTASGGGIDINKVLRDNNLQKDVVDVANGLYVKSDDKEQIIKIIDALQQVPNIGPIVSRYGHGTIHPSFLHWDHSRNPDIWVTPNWNDDENEFGYKGTTFTGGTAGHGSLSFYDINIPLIANGPAFAHERKIYNLPTSNADIAPTVCFILGITPPETMDGRVAGRLLKDPNAPEETSIMPKFVAPEVNGHYAPAVYHALIGQYAYIEKVTVSYNGKPDFLNK